MSQEDPIPSAADDAVDPSPTNTLSDTTRAKSDLIKDQFASISLPSYHNEPDAGIASTFGFFLPPEIWDWMDEPGGQDEVGSAVVEHLQYVVRVVEDLTGAPRVVAELGADRTQTNEGPSRPAQWRTPAGGRISTVSPVLRMIGRTPSSNRQGRPRAAQTMQTESKTTVEADRFEGDD